MWVANAVCPVSAGHFARTCICARCLRPEKVRACMARVSRHELVEACARVPAFTCGTCLLRVSVPYSEVTRRSLRLLCRLQIRTTPLDGRKQYIFGWHPHGIIILSRVSVYGGVFRDLFPGIDMRGADSGMTPWSSELLTVDVCSAGSHTHVFHSRLPRGVLVAGCH
jgi:hypothetical protein